MRTAWLVTIAAGTLVGGAALQQKSRLNPVIELLAAKKPAFGLYAPANPRVGGRGGRGAAQAGSAGGTAPAAAPAPQKTQAELARDAFAYKGGDYIFDGTMEVAPTDTTARFDSAYARFQGFSKGLADAGSISTTAARSISHPLFVKTGEILPNPKLAGERIAKQLNAGAMGIVFVDVQNADEVKQGLAMMRFRSQGGTRPDDVGNAPALWGMSEKEYREKADLWPLNPNGELLNFTIVESKEGVNNVRSIAAVKGIGVLFPGAGTLGGVYTKVDSTGRTVRDPVAWENAIQQVLSACKEFNVPCGYPANDSTMMQQRLKEGFTVFITAWGENGFKAVEVGKRVGGR